VHPPRLEADVDSTLPVSGACDAEAFLRMRELQPGDVHDLAILFGMSRTAKVLRLFHESADEDNISGRTAFEWLPGGFFFQQRIEMSFMGLPIQSLELIAYDPSTEAFSSQVFSNLAGVPLPYEWDVQGDVLTISMATAKFRGTFSEDGKSFSGGWRPDPGKEGPENVAYDVTGTRVS
jgi:hypothetical protein